MMHQLFLLLLPDTIGLATADFLHVIGVILIILWDNDFDNLCPPYVPKRIWPPTSIWIKSFIESVTVCCANVEKLIHCLMQSRS